MFDKLYILDSTFQIMLCQEKLCCWLKKEKENYSSHRLLENDD